MSSSGKFEYDVKITDGTCSCPYFLRENIPCKHIFSVFEHSTCSWANLPLALTEIPHMMLEMNISRADHCEPQYTDDVSDHADQVAAADHVDPVNDHIDLVVDHVDPAVDHVHEVDDLVDQVTDTCQSVHTEIPTYQPSGRHC